VAQRPEQHDDPQAAGRGDGPPPGNTAPPSLLDPLERGLDLFVVQTHISTQFGRSQKVYVG
jgi:hypothetical protein